MSAPTLESESAVGLGESGAALNPERAEPFGGADIIDQLVVDGCLTNACTPISFDELMAPVLGPDWRTEPHLGQVLIALRRDPRCLGFDDRQGFFFRPEVTPNSKIVLPSWQAVVSGRVSNVPAAYVAEIKMAMMLYAETIYLRHDVRDRPERGVVPGRELWGMIWWRRDALAQMGMPLTPRSFAAFMELIDLPKNGYFHRLPDDRVVLTRGVFSGNPEGIVPLWPIYDMHIITKQVVDMLRQKGVTTVSPSLVFRTIEEEFRSFVTPKQRAELHDCMLDIMGVHPTGRSRYQILQPMRVPKPRAGRVMATALQTDQE